MVSCNGGLSRLDIGNFTGAPISVLRVNIGKFFLFGVVNGFSQSGPVGLRHIKKPHYRW